MDNSQSVDVQAQIRRNADEQNSCLKDLILWEEKIKKQDANLRRQAASSKKNVVDKQATSATSTPSDVIGEAFTQVPLQFPSLKSSSATTPAPKVASRTSLAEGSETLSATKPKSRETPAEISAEERQRGNTYFSKGNFKEAIRCYTRCLSIDPQSALAYSNRAIAHLKVKDWTRAERDASSALELDPTHIKSYQRRSAARLSLGKLRASLRDLHLAETMTSNVPRSNPQRELVADRKRVEAALQAAARRAPKREIAVVVLDEDITLGEETNPQKCCLTTDDANKNHVNSVEMQTAPSGFTLHSSKNKTKPSYEKPNTWYQFEAIWKTLDTQTQRSDFLASMKPRRVVAMYKHGFENADLLVSIIAAAVDTGDAADYLRSLASIKSIDMTAMMMTSGQKALVRDAVRDSFSKEIAGGDANEVAKRLGC